MTERQNGGAPPRRKARLLPAIGGLLMAGAVATLSPAPSFAGDPPKGCSRSHQRKANRWGTVLVAPPAPTLAPAPTPPPAQAVPPGKAGRPSPHRPGAHRKTSEREGAPRNVPQAADPRPFYRSC